MAQNLVDAIQRNLQYPPLHKIDPNTQEINNKEGQPVNGLLGQATIPAVLTALYSLSRTEDGSEKILQAPAGVDALPVLFNSKENHVIEQVAHYAEVLSDQAESHLENVADEALRLVQQQMGPQADPHKLKLFMNDQRHNILVYLPPALNMGDLLKDNTLDDRTNKMEGPVSSFMHKIENKLSQGGE